MTAPGFSRRSEHWRALTNRYTNRLLIGAGAVVLLVLPTAILLINGGEVV